VSRLLETVAPSRLGVGFRLLVGSSWVGNLGDGIALAAGPLLVASQTDDARIISLAALLTWAPGFLFGLYAGALADRLDRRLVIVVGNLVRAVVIAVLVAMLAADRVDVGVVLTMLFVIGTAETFVDATSVTVMPMLVGKRDLGVANARMMFGHMGLNRLVGPPLGAALFTAGLFVPFAAQLACVLLAVVLIARIALPAREEPTQPTRVLRDIWEGFRWSMRHPAMRALNLQIVTFNVTYGASWGVLVLYSQERLGMDDVGYGLLLGATAVGGVIGAVTYGWLERHVRIADIMRYGLVLEALTHAVLAWTTLPAVALGVLLLFGIHEAYWGSTAGAVRQRAVPRELQGRVSSVYLMFMMGGLVAGTVLGGFLAEHGGIAAPYWFGFVGSAVILAALWTELGRIAHADEEIRAEA